MVRGGNWTVWLKSPVLLEADTESVISVAFSPAVCAADADAAPEVSAAETADRGIFKPVDESDSGIGDEP